MGTAPGFGLPAGDFPSYVSMREKTFDAFADLDASPTKAWMLTHLATPAIAAQVDLTLGLRPREELFDIRRDPDHLHNLASEPEFQEVKQQLSERLLTTLAETGDPRVLGDGSTFDLPPFAP